MKADRILQAALALMLVAFCGTLYNSLHETIVNAGDTAPNFSIQADTGRTITSRDFGGKLLLLNFWATWCATCIEEIPSLNQMARQLAPQGLVVLGVSVDKDEKLYRDFLSHSPLTYLTARDPEAKINLSYGTKLFPESYLIDRNGKVIEKFISSQPWDSPQMIRHVQSLL
jgi:cytochrome c biogenesis protein CcmG, thiol:disulfide interchange protein DsbE